ncbi:MAG: hydroxyethylthiazole kinase [Propionibacteriaceae bacterium]|nr:hydroxyethylthiazole kinase [Propionibacteriaceae bacterium]
MDRSGLALTVGFAVETVRENAPLVHCVAPRAATSFVAEVLHGAGASSVVTGTSPEALGSGLTADSVMFDLGTLASEWSDAINPTVAQLRSQGTPWVLDATPLGRETLRADRVRGLLGHRPTVIRASSAEVDGVKLEATDGALALGASEVRVLWEGQEVAVLAGSEMLGQVPGVRAAVTALMAACSTATGPVEAALAGAAWLALAADRAEEHSRGPASFRIALVDALATVHGDEVADYLTRS